MTGDEESRRRPATRAPMSVGTQKDYYAILDVDRKAFRRLERKSEGSIDLSPVRNGVKRHHLSSVVYPQRNPVVPNTVLVEACQVGRRIPEGLRDHFRMPPKIVNLLHDPASHGRVKFTEISFETRGRLDPIGTAHLRQPNFQILCSVKRSSWRNREGQAREALRAYRARLPERVKSRLNSSHDRVLPESCSRRALRSLRSKAGLCRIRKSSNASCNSSSASLARRNLLSNSAGTSTVWPIYRSRA